MNMNINNGFKIFCIIAILSVLPAINLSAQTVGGLSIPPEDTVDAERVRIWFPVETTGKCRLDIKIFNENGKEVRHLINFLADPGYYNFYWDKKDDAGNFVPIGTYPYTIKYCGGDTRKRELTVQYSKWEKAVHFSPMDTSSVFNMIFKVSEDSVPTSIIICNRRGVPMDTLLMDSLLNKGDYQFDWNPEKKIRRGNYIIKVIVGDYLYKREVTYLP